MEGRSEEGRGTRKSVVFDPIEGGLDSIEFEEGGRWESPACSGAIVCWRGGGNGCHLKSC